MGDTINNEGIRIPEHVAIILDGNGRWAKKRGLARSVGHKIGIDKVIEILNEAKTLGVKVLTVFAFSTENWKRDIKEINNIFSLLESMIDSRKDEFIKDNIKFTIIGDLSRLEDEFSSLKNKLESLIEKTKNNNGINFNIAFNYGSHDEIIKAVRNVASDVKNEKISLLDINEDLFEEYLMTKGMPKIDLMIRTSGECRLSNFLLWQLAYSELCFVPDYWPDIDKCTL